MSKQIDSITIKASDYRYPSRAELKEVYKTSPDFSNFGFKSKNPIISLLTNERSIPEIHKADNLQYWDAILLNRNGSLMHTYHNAIIHFNRGVPDELESFTNKQHYINRVQFDYYAEYFYHHFSTVSDTIGQLLNVYFDIGQKVDKLHFNADFCEKLSDQNVISAIKTYFNETFLAKNYRNSFTHRTPINYPDTRSSISLEDGRYTYGSANHNFIKPSEIKDNLDLTILALSKFLKTLKSILKT